MIICKHLLNSFTDIKNVLLFIKNKNNFRMFELRRLFCKRDGEKKADCSSSNFILLENHITILEIACRCLNRVIMIN